MELFDKKFVHFMWDDSLKGKELFLANNIDTLICNVNSSNKEFCRQTTRVDFEDDWTFAYYDPYYDFKKAFNEGKLVQIKDNIHGDWQDVKYENVLWEAKGAVFRIKPSTVHVILDSNGDWATTSEYSEEKHGHSFKTFDDLDAAIDWTNRHSEWSKVAKAWEESKKIQFHDPRVLDYPDWFDCEKPTWIDGCEYRIKPELMTYRHLAEWLAKGNGEFKFLDEIRNTHWGYTPDTENTELRAEYKIRRWGSDEWIEPTEQIYLEDCVAYSPNGPKED